MCSPLRVRAPTLFPVWLTAGLVQAAIEDLRASDAEATAPLLSAREAEKKERTSERRRLAQVGPRRLRRRGGAVVPDDALRAACAR